MPKYEVVFDYVAPGHYKGAVVEAEALGDEGAAARMLKLGAVRELTEEQAAQIAIDELELSDGDGIAYNAQGINVAPDAPPQPDPGSLAARTAKRATTSAALPGAGEPGASGAAANANGGAANATAAASLAPQSDAQVAADKAAADKAAADKAAADKAAADAAGSNS